MWFVLLSLIPVVLSQVDTNTNTDNTWNPQPVNTWNAQPVGGNTHEVQPAPGPGPYIHKDYYPPQNVVPPRVPIGQVEQRLRRIEVFLGLIDPECRNNYVGNTKELRRMTYTSDPNFIYHSTVPEKQDTARRAGYTTEDVLGRVATDPYDQSCECLIPLYRRNADHHVYRIEYRTRETYPRRTDFVTGKDFPVYDYQGDLKNWAVEGYCVPYRGACGATVQLSAMTPPKRVGDDRPLTLVTTDADRVKWGYEKGWDETTLCYIWNP